MYGYAHQFLMATCSARPEVLELIGISKSMNLLDSIKARTLLVVAFNHTKDVARLQSYLTRSR